MPNHIEKAFADRENIYAPLLRKIIKICLNKNNEQALICNSRERRLLCEFTTNMFLRNPITMKANKIDTLDEKITNHPEIVELKELFELLFTNGFESILLAAQKNSFLGIDFPNGLHQNIADIFYEMNCTFMVSDSNHFITSNFPAVVVAENIDNKNWFQMAYIPIHPFCAVIFQGFDLSRKYRNRVLKVPPNIVHSFNSCFFSMKGGIIEQVFSIDKKDIKDLIK